jgi:hypothetical protein
MLDQTVEEARKAHAARYPEDDPAAELRLRCASAGRPNNILIEVLCYRQWLGQDPIPVRLEEPAYYLFH